MRERFFKTICVIMAVLLLSGCWDAREIEDREICTTVIVDKDEDGIVFYVEVAAVTSALQNPVSEQGQKQPTTSIVSAHGKTFAEAREALDRELNKPVFIGAVQALIMTRNMAEYGIEEYIYRVRQMNEYRKTIDVIVTEDDPSEFLKISPENASAIGFALEFTLENLFESGKTFHMSLADLLDKLASRNDCYLMSMVSGKSGQIALSGYAVFDGSKMIGTIPIDKIKGVVYIAAYQTAPDFNYVVPVQDTHVTVEAKMIDRDISAAYENNKARFDLNFSFEGTEKYPETGSPITDAMQQEITSRLQEMIRDEIAGALETSQCEFGCDYMSLSEAFRIKYPDKYKNMDWQQEFRNADFTVSVSVVLGPDKTFDYNPHKK